MVPESFVTGSTHVVRCSPYGVGGDSKMENPHGGDRESFHGGKAFEARMARVRRVQKAEDNLIDGRFPAAALGSAEKMANTHRKLVLAQALKTAASQRDALRAELERTKEWLDAARTAIDRMLAPVAYEDALQAGREALAACGQRADGMDLAQIMGTLDLVVRELLRDRLE